MKTGAHLTRMFCIAHLCCSPVPFLWHSKALMAEEVKASLPRHPVSVLPEENGGLTGAGLTGLPDVSVRSRAQPKLTDLKLGVWPRVISLFHPLAMMANACRTWPSGMMLSNFDFSMDS